MPGSPTLSSRQRACVLETDRSRGHRNSNLWLVDSVKQDQDIFLNSDRSLPITDDLVAYLPSPAPGAALRPGSAVCERRLIARHRLDSTNPHVLQLKMGTASPNLRRGQDLEVNWRHVCREEQVTNLLPKRSHFYFRALKNGLPIVFISGGQR